MNKVEFKIVVVTDDVDDPDFALNLIADALEDYYDAYTVEVVRNERVNNDGLQ